MGRLARGLKPLGARLYHSLSALAVRIRHAENQHN